ncbi:sulfurtransferase-like selenium metabolism protein YedF [Cetobacterium sp.]|uniref:sulfurtransferase-like selenium metabolism protein YedF n=1 Tax=Cetobacterium sp. TaxID=2071632 RepID=UPI003F3F53E8
MIKVNAIGLTCPMPVILTKNALKSLVEGSIEVTVDNKISKENIEKFSKEMGYFFNTKNDGDIFYIEIIKNELATLNLDVKNDKNTVIVIDSDKMGEGDSALGNTLMQGFIYTLTEMEDIPKSIIFYNRGVFLTAENQNTISYLKSLEDRGVEILSCGACINFYNLEATLGTGTITNMYNIIDKQMKALKVIKP